MCVAGQKKGIHADSDRRTVRGCGAMGLLQCGRRAAQEDARRGELVRDVMYTHIGVVFVVQRWGGGMFDTNCYPTIERFSVSWHDCEQQTCFVLCLFLVVMLYFDYFQTR